PLVTNSLVFLATNDGFGVCVDAETGAEQWRERLGKAFRASPLAAGGRVYFFAREGKGTVVEAGRQFQVVAQNSLGEEVIASPAVTVSGRGVMNCCTGSEPGASTRPATLMSRSRSLKMPTRRPRSSTTGTAPMSWSSRRRIASWTVVVARTVTGGRGLRARTG